MDIKVVDKSNTSPVKSVADEVKPPATMTVSAMPEMDQKAIQQALGLENDGDKTKYKHEVDLLLQWAKENAKGKTPDDLKWAIRTLELRVGTPPISENRVRYLAQYAYLASEHKRIENDMKKFHSMG